MPVDERMLLEAMESSVHVLDAARGVCEPIGVPGVRGRVGPTPFGLLNVVGMARFDADGTEVRGRDQIQHVHLSNNAGKGWDSHLPVYADGVLPLHEFLDDVVEDGGHERGRVHAELREHLGHAERVHDVRLAGHALLPAVRRLGDLVCAQDRLEVDARRVLLDRGRQRLDPVGQLARRIEHR
jgi:hypothetical protein